MFVVVSEQHLMGALRVVILSAFGWETDSACTLPGGEGAERGWRRLQHEPVHQRDRRVHPASATRNQLAGVEDDGFVCLFVS